MELLLAELFVPDTEMLLLETVQLTDIEIEIDDELFVADCELVELFVWLTETMLLDCD